MIGVFWALKVPMQFSEKLYLGVKGILAVIANGLLVLKKTK